MTELLFFLGFVALIGGAHSLVEGAASLGRKLHIPSIVIGLTIVAFGTSLPELVISSFAAFQGETELSIANVLGSNLLNILIILGITAIIIPIPANSNTVFKVIPGSIFITVVLFIMMFFLNQGKASINRMEGILLLVLFVLYLLFNRRMSKNSVREHHEESIKTYSVFISLLITLLGLGALFIGGRWIVNGATAIATKLGISQSVIGLTLVALATSLPELVTSVVAALKKKTDIAIGNLVGSNIFNILMVLGVSSVIRPLPVYPELKTDLIIVLATTVLLFLMLVLKRKKFILQRIEGGILVTAYIIYILFRL